ncbi:hypothetical protein BJ138DRAFT_541639 [Hygrophoropsis aurantiaca]|uniref:Uncharacterized protein n=1 Tax=Hygrophoropsis aurantiaca TaxID=72124 RepID=A0ACB8A259_9AGAM|nr:hypothetical protein BJ138DRAFT_541639 [Hygrophoropsis aurantiaca]
MAQPGQPTLRSHPRRTSNMSQPEAETTIDHWMESVNAWYALEKPMSLKKHAARLPMEQLPDEYRVTQSNPDPPLLHFALGMDEMDLLNYAEVHHLTRYNFPQMPSVPSPDTLDAAVEHLSRIAGCELHLCKPYGPTTEYLSILELYNNYSMEEKTLSDEAQERVVKIVKEKLELAEDVHLTWYFDRDDEWTPDEGDDQ